MKDTSGTGTRTEGIVLGALLRGGYSVLLPFGGCLAYDMAVDINGEIKRVQCKTGRLVSGCVVFNAASMNRDTKIRKSYKGRADLFGVYCPTNEQCYLVPVELVGVEGRLRVQPARNNQTSKVRWANEFLIKSG